MMKNKHMISTLFAVGLVLSGNLQAMQYATRALRCALENKNASTATIAALGLGIFAAYKGGYLSCNRDNDRYPEVYDFYNKIEFTKEEIEAKKKQRIEDQQKAAAARVSWFAGLKDVSVITATWWGVCTAYSVSKTACHFGKSVLNAVFPAPSTVTAAK